ncbi:glycosyltransferase [Peribacillus frigoritolerans]|uniref:glycosyltransferase n=1 Tax=Peribacillus frigoritolerans TaxID=450367 RepID=UPI00315DADB1
MNKKILFMLINLNIGGTEKALLNMISELTKNKYDITILMLEKYGGFLNYLPDGVRVEIVPEYKHIKNSLNTPLHKYALDLFKEGHLIKSFVLMFFYLISKVTKERSLYYKYILRGFPVVEHEYDIAVAYAGPMDFISYFVINKIKAKKKIQWIHFDVSQIGFNKFFASKVYKKFDKIFVVSKEGRKHLVSILPSIKERTEVFSNLLSQELIKSQAEKGRGFTDEFEGVRILTVGRLSFEKGQDIAIQALTRLIHNGYKARWYCVGEGNSRLDLENLIQKNNVSEHFILLGSNPNPYPYIKNCDIYVQPSRHEGYCITLAEARCLNKPIITTGFTGAKEQIKNGVTGVIVNCDEDEIYQAIVMLITETNLCKKLTGNLSAETIDTKNEIKKIVNI